MRFGAFDIGACEGLILAHSHKLAGKRIAKGSVLTAELVDAFRQDGVTELVCAAPDAGDLSEDQVAGRLAAAMMTAGVSRSEAATGRVNFKVGTTGIIRYDRALITALNSVDEALTFSLVQHNQLLSAGQMAATLKVIPYFVAEQICQHFEHVLQGRPAFTFHPLRSWRVSLIQTMDDVLSERVYTATETVTERRLAQLGSKLTDIRRCAHDSSSVSAEISQALATGVDLILLCGCSAVVDRRDVLPVAIEQAGGQIDQLGLAVDPGNMLLAAHIQTTPVIGMPGCARSPKLNGFDWVLHLLLAGVPLSREELADMASGGLLMEIASRPLPRDLASKSPPAAPHMGVVLLAAGQSRRMGEINKLTVEIAGKPVIRYVAETILAAGLKDVVVVLGHDSQAVERCLDGLPVRFVVNEAHQSGQASSVGAGVAALNSKVTDVMIVLGDMPLLSPSFLQGLQRHHLANSQHEKMICLPVHTKDGQRQVGHPVVWGRQFFSELQRLRGDQGGRQIWAEHPAMISHLTVDDPTFFLDTDTPDALQQVETLLLARNRR